MLAFVYSLGNNWLIFFPLFLLSANATIYVTSIIKNETNVHLLVLKQWNKKENEETFYCVWYFPPNIAV